MRISNEIEIKEILKSAKDGKLQIMETDQGDAVKGLGGEIKDCKNYINLINNLENGGHICHYDSFDRRGMKIVRFEITEKGEELLNSLS